jgi:hypothetical protein
MGWWSRFRLGEVCALVGEPTGGTIAALTTHGRVDCWDPATGASSRLTDDAAAVAVADAGDDIYVVGRDLCTVTRFVRRPRLGNRSRHVRGTTHEATVPLTGEGLVVALREDGLIGAMYLPEERGISIRQPLADPPAAPLPLIATALRPRRLALSADGTLLVGSFDTEPPEGMRIAWREWRAWRTEDGAPVGDAHWDGPRITAIAVARDGPAATVAAAAGGTVRTWRIADVATTTSTDEGLVLPTGPAGGLHLAAGDRGVTTASPDGTLRRWPSIYGPVLGGPLPDTMAPRRLAATSLALLALALWWVLQAIGDVLRDLHLPGSLGAYSIPDLVSLTSTPGTAAGRLRVWADWDASREITGQALTSTVVGTAWLVVDTLFAVSLGVLAVLVVAWRRRARAFEPTEHARAVCALLRIARWAAVTYIAADVVENVALAVAVRIGPGATVPLWIAYVVGFVKLAAIAYTALVVLISFVGIDRSEPGADIVRATSPKVWQTVLELRAEALAVGIITVALLFLPSNVRPQLHDVVRDWRRDPGELVAAAVAVVALSLSVLVLGARGLQRAWAYRAEEIDFGPVPSPTRRVMAFIACAVVVLTVLGYLVLEAWLGEGWFAVVVAAIAAVYLLPLVSGTVRQVPARRAGFTPSTAVLRLLAILPCVALVVVWVRAEVGKALEEPGRLFVLVGLLVGLAAVATVVYLPPVQRLGAVFGPRGSLLLSRDELGRQLHGRQGFRLPEVWVALFLFAVAGSLLVLIDVGRFGKPTSIGAVAIIAIWTIAVLGLLVAANALLFGPPHGLLALVGARRFPTLLAVLLAGLVMSQLVSRPGFHRADIVDAERPELIAVADAFEMWVTSQVPNQPDPDRPWVPLVIIAASGGGGRAAYWTELALGCTFGGGVELDQPACTPGDGKDDTVYEDVFAISGISGGSVGAAMYEASRGRPGENADDVFAEGFVDPIVSNLVVRDVPNALLYATNWEDRAERLEREWEHAIPSLAEPYFRARSADHWRPLLLLNSATVEDGCRVVVADVAVAVDTTTAPRTSRDLSGSCRSLIQERLTPPGDPDDLGGDDDVDVAAQPWPATRDLGSILCDDQNLATSTAALLSARFPYVSPSGSIEYCDDTDRFTYLVDGGTVDSSAAAPASLLLEEVVRRVRDHNDRRGDGPCIQPVVLQIDNGYEDVLAAPNGTRPSELVVPLAGGISALTNNAETARQQLAVLASQLRTRAGCEDPQLPDLPTYLQIFPQSHPGTEAPLGWSLSHEAREDMKDQLGSSANQCSLMALRMWLTGSPGDGACLTGTVEEPGPPAQPGERREPGPAVSGHDVRLCLAPGAEPIDVPTNPYGVFVVVVDGDVTLPPPEEVVCDPDIELVGDRERWGFGIPGEMWVGASFELRPPP